MGNEDREHQNGKDWCKLLASNEYNVNHLIVNEYRINSRGLTFQTPYSRDSDGPVYTGLLLDMLE